MKLFNIIIYILFNILIRITFEIFCDKTQYCSNCSLCGKDNNNYCSCNFNNAFCIDEENNNYKFISDFLFDYDGCMNNNNEFYEICGSSNINLEIGIINTIQFSSKNEKDVLCYYNAKKSSNNNNNLLINIKKESSNYIDFSIFLVYYQNNENIKISSISNIRGKTPVYYNLSETHVEKVSLYISINDASNIGDLSIDFYVETNFITKISKEIDSNKIVKIVLIVIVSILGVLIIIIIILLIRKCKMKKNLEEKMKKNNRLSLSETKNKDKLIMNILQSNELLPKIFYQNGIASDHYKCTICLENFKDGVSVVTNTKCGHIFHFNCFKNWIEKNIIKPKCPNCNKFILKQGEILDKNIVGNTNLNSFFKSNTQITPTTNITMNNTNEYIENGRTIIGESTIS